MYFMKYFGVSSEQDRVGSQLRILARPPGVRVLRIQCIFDDEISRRVKISFMLHIGYIWCCQRVCNQAASTSSLQVAAYVRNQITEEGRHPIKALKCCITTCSERLGEVNLYCSTHSGRLSISVYAMEVILFSHLLRLVLSSNIILRMGYKNKFLSPRRFLGASLCRHRMRAPHVGGATLECYFGRL